MAIVGEAHIIVKAITTGVERDIRNGFQNVEGAGTDAGKRLGKSYGNGFWAGYNSSNSSKVFGRIADGLRQLEGEAEQSVKVFQRLVTANYFVSGGLGVLVGTIGQAVVGLGALVASGVGAAASLAAVGSAAISARIGLSTIGFAMKGISQAVGAATSANNSYTKSLKEAKFEAEEASLSVDRAALNLENARESMLRTQDLPAGSRVRREAELAYKEAELAYRRAQDAKKAAGKNAATGGAADPYAGLTPSQKSFAQYLVGIKGKLNELREAVASGFLPKLKIAIESMLKSTFPTFKVGLKGIGSAMGDAAVEFAKAFDNKKVQSDLAKFFSNVAKNVKPLGVILSSISIGLIRFLNAAQPITDRFIKWVTKISEGFNNWTLKNEKTKGITNFLMRAADAAAILGGIFKNVFGGLGAIIDENLKPGSGGMMLLEWIREATAGFAKIGESEGFRTIFQEAAKGTKALLQVIGKVIGFFIQFAGDPNVTKFWETIRDGFPNMESVVKAISDALPSIAEFINEVGGIFAVLGENDGLKTFFDTLRDIAKGAKEVIKAIAPLLAFLAPVLAIITAFRLFGKVLKFLGLTGLGLINRFKNFFKTLKGVFGVFNRGNKEAKKGQKEVGDSVDRTEKNVKRMNKAVTATEKAFKSMNTAIQSVNKSLTTFKDRINNALTPLTRLKNNSRGAVTQLKGVKNEGDKAATKLARIKSEGTKAEGSLKRVKKAASDARKELNLLGKTKSSPTIGSRTGGTGGGTSGDGGGGGLTILGGKGLTGALKSPIAKFGVWGAAAAVAGGMIADATKPMVDQANAAATTATQLDILAKANGGLSGAAKGLGKKLVDLAYDQSMVTGISVDQYFAVEKLLMKYPSLAKTANITGGTFQTLVTKSADLAIAMGTDAPTAAQIMADAFKDPATAMQTLIDQGIPFTQAEQDKYDAILKTNGAADAQKILLDSISGKYDGLAKKSASSSDIAVAAWARVNKRVGEIIAPWARFFDQFSTAIANLAFILMGGDPKLTPAQKAFSQKVQGTLNNYNFSAGVLTPKVNPIKPYEKPFSTGGLVTGPGSGTSDSISAMLSNGEFVVNAKATARNRGLLEAINSNKGASVGTTINMVVNAAPGMDEKELASIVSRKIAFAMTKGGY